MLVGIGIYLFPFLLPKVINQIGSSKLIYLQPTNITMKKEKWELITEIVKSDCRSKNPEWIQWGDKIIGHIKEKTDRVTSAEENVTISFYQNNLKTLKNIIARLGLKS